MQIQRIQPPKEKEKENLSSSIVLIFSADYQMYIKCHLFHISPFVIPNYVRRNHYFNSRIVQKNRLKLISRIFFETKSLYF